VVAATEAPFHANWFGGVSGCHGNTSMECTLWVVFMSSPMTLSSSAPVKPRKRAPPPLRTMLMNSFRFSSFCCCTTHTLSARNAKWGRCSPSPSVPTSHLARR
jgi:hypothetical protein